MIESTEAWKADIEKAKRIVKRLNRIATDLRSINSEHVSTAECRDYLARATGQLMKHVDREHRRWIEEVYGNKETRQ